MYHLINISATFGSNGPSGFEEEDLKIFHYHLFSNLTLIDLMRIHQKMSLLKLHTIIGDVNSPSHQMLLICIPYFL
jgi:hypothetical protein